MNDPAPSIQLHVNGEIRLVPMGCSLEDLISSLGLPPQAVLVEHNGQALLRAEWPRCVLAEGDQLEILRVVAGG